MRKELDSHFYQVIVEKSINAVVITNSSGDIISWSTTAERIFGYSSSEVMGTYVHDILPAHDLRKKANESFKTFQDKSIGPLIGKSILVRGLKKMERYFMSNGLLFQNISAGNNNTIKCQ